MSRLEINLCGLARSGNHAIIFWMIHNIAEVKEVGEHQIYADDQNKICFINNISHHHSDFRSKFDTAPYQTVIKSHEDREHQGSFIILRDFINLISSRYRLYGELLAYRKEYCPGIHNIIELWKRHASRQIILYNRWIDDKAYRDKVAELVGIPNINDNIRHVSPIGTGSSFGGVRLFEKEEYLKRYQRIKLPQNVTQPILDDKELIKINKDLFGMDITQILNIATL